MKTALKKTSRNLILLGLLTIFMLSAMIIASYNQFEKSSIELRKHEIKRLVELGVNSIQCYRDDYKKGLISREEALEEITNLVRRFTFEDELQPNYLFMSSYEGAMLVQPYQPELEGSNQIDLIDTEGKYIIRELITQAKTGPGYITYKYFPPGSDIAYQKISYVVGLPELECYIGTGLYSADISLIIKKHFNRTLLFMLFTAGILISCAAIFIYPIIYSVQHIVARLIDLGDKPLLEVPPMNLDKFGPNTDAARLLNMFNSIMDRLATKNRELLDTAAEQDRLKTEHIKHTEMLVKEMNHRIKNNLQLIISLLQIQLSKTENEIIRASHIETINRLESISIIHNMLCSNEDNSSIQAEKYIKDITYYIIHSSGSDYRIKTVFEIEDIKLTIEQAVSLGIITNEVITNSVKYAFPNDDEGTVYITLKGEKGKFIFQIRDDGTGFPTAVEDNESSLGITLIRNISKQMGGNLEMQTENGTYYRFTF